MARTHEQYLQYWRNRRAGVKLSPAADAPMTFAEIARRLNTTPQDAWRLYQSGMQKLRQGLGIQAAEGRE